MRSLVSRSVCWGGQTWVKYINQMKNHNVGTSFITIVKYEMSTITICMLGWADLGKIYETNEESQ